MLQDYSVAAHQRHRLHLAGQEEASSWHHGKLLPIRLDSPELNGSLLSFVCYIVINTCIRSIPYTLISRYGLLADLFASFRIAMTLQLSNMLSHSNNQVNTPWLGMMKMNGALKKCITAIANSIILHFGSLICFPQSQVMLSMFAKFLVLLSQS